MPLAYSMQNYLKGKQQRETLRALGYDPGNGISNIGPPGTHDTDWIFRNLREFDASTENSTFELGNFDLAKDDQLPEPVRIKGKVGIFILEGMFVGANTEFHLAGIPPGFKRTVAESLQHDYKPIFDRLNALWVFQAQDVGTILAQAMERERTLEAIGQRVWGDEVLRDRIRYSYIDPWDQVNTSPLPRMKDTTFWAAVDGERRFKDIKRGGRYTPVPSAAGAEERERQFNGLTTIVDGQVVVTSDAQLITVLKPGHRQIVLPSAGVAEISRIFRMPGMQLQASVADSVGEQNIQDIPENWVGRKAFWQEWDLKAGDVILLDIPAGQDAADWLPAQFPRGVAVLNLPGTQAAGLQLAQWASMVEAALRRGGILPRVEEVVQASLDQMVLDLGM